MLAFKYRLVTDEAKCGSMGRTRHLLKGVAWPGNR